MRKLEKLFVFACLMLLFACGDTTKRGSNVNEDYNAADSAVGNSEAANTIYRDSTDIRHGTETGGGTGNPSVRSDTVRSDSADR